MKKRLVRFKTRVLSQERRGFALLISLSAVVLLTILILAFFSRAMLNRQISFSSTNQIKADMLARSAVEVIEAELRQEALDAAASSSTTDGFTPSTQGVTNPDAAVGAFTIAKVSSPNTVISPGGKIYGSAVSVSMASLNGRKKSNWFSSGPGLGSADLPTWSYVTRANEIKLPSLADAKNPLKDDYVVGRFAYTVYDTSGMLDANVAGYPMPAPPAAAPFAISAANVGSKASTTYADLTQIGMTVTQVNELVKWRNASLVTSSAIDAEKAASYDEWATGIPRISGAPNTAALSAARSGHLGLSVGDNAFFSRRDLIRFSKRPGMSAAMPASMTHFSRAETIPSWGPSNVAGSTIAYGDKANDMDSVNRFLPNVVADAMSVRYYNDDGTFTPVGIDSGDPLVTRRFSLAKLAWLGHNGPNTTAFNSSLSAAERERAIKTCFGLEWNLLKKRWDYSHGDPNGILTLDKVRRELRQPDFFELLKAGILTGSLGQHPGIVAGDINFTVATPKKITPAERKQYWEGPIGSHYETYSSDHDRHILQIGANIIDQADNNNFPIALYLPLYSQASFSESENELNNTVFGTENLPVIQRLRNHIHANADTYTEGNVTPTDPLYPVLPVGVWLQPEMWNPHNSATVGLSVNDANYPTPTSLRIVTFGKVYVWNIKADKDMNNVLDPGWVGDSQIVYPAGTNFGSTPKNFGNDVNAPSVEGILCFKNPKPGNTVPPDFYDKPVGLTGKGSASAANNYYDITSPSGPDNSHPVNANWLGSPNGDTRYMGIFLGNVPQDGDHNSSDTRTIPDPYLSFVLQYYDGSSWRSYAVFNRLEALMDGGGGSGSRYGQSGFSSSNGRIDPRTDRFSGSSGAKGTGDQKLWHAGTVRLGPGKKIQASVNGTEAAGRSPIFQGWPHPTAGFVHGSASNLGLVTADAALIGASDNSFMFDDWMRNITSAGWTGDPINRPLFWYADPDGVVRPGDGLHGVGWEVVNSADDKGDGMPTYLGDDTRVTVSKTRRRPVILNRPFRSVGELGYVFRDLPFKTLDFWSDKTGDAGLLDLFCVSQTETGIEAGKINLNAATPKVLQSILKDATKEASDATKAIQTNEAEVVAQAITANLLSNGPTAGPSELVSRFSAIIFNAFAQAGNGLTDKPIYNKTYAEAPVRALAANMTDRTWNLLIDVVAQSGRLGAHADGPEDFMIEGERRYWLHVAIDRFTGQVVDRQLEPFYE